VPILSLPRARPALDPRFYQLLVLSTLLLYGITKLDLALPPEHAVLILLSALLCQWAGTRLRRLPAFDPKSALISGLSLCLLLRTSSPLLAAAAAAAAIGSKFLIRVRGKHVFNPTNFAIVILIATTGQAWVSPSQWGSAPTFAFLLACLGGIVVNRAARSDVSFAFLAVYAAILFGRAARLGDPLSIPLRQLQSGSLLIFAFFMISDPKTTPNSRTGRLLFALLVALGAGYVQFVLFRTNGLLWSLVCLSPLVPLFDLLLPGSRYAWRGATREEQISNSLLARIFGERPILAAPPRSGQVVDGPRRQGPFEASCDPSTCAHAASPRTNQAVSAALAPFFQSASYLATSPVPHTRPRRPKENRMKRPVPLLAAVLLLVLPHRSAGAFCGFYVGKADTRLFNRASSVALVRDGDRTVMTMSSDYRGTLEEFALVVPVPTFIEREQIHVTDRAYLDHLDAYSAPRLVEYFDEDPCMARETDEVKSMAAPPPRNSAQLRKDEARGLGVTIEAQYTVGEYDIMILSAKQSGGLEEWLLSNGYKIPSGASAVLGSYIRQGMHFFVAKVNLKEQNRLGFQALRPIQVAYESPKFMLPIRLGTVNADGPQEMFVFALTRGGRVETTNYRTVKLPTGMDLPVFLKQKDEFARFYRDLFTRQVAGEGMKAVFLEYAWDMTWCDPCAAPPLAPAELRELGVFWLDAASDPSATRLRPDGGPQTIFLTRLHVRYDRDHFPEDLVFQQTADRENFQGRYILRHAWTGDSRCPAASSYRDSLGPRWAREAQSLADLTGWKLDTIRIKMRRSGADPDRVAGAGAAWWKGLWK
jgi:hypothetical protein